MASFKKVLPVLFAVAFAGSALATGKTVPWLSPTSDTGMRHINMYQLYGGTMACSTCHKRTDPTVGVGPDVPPSLGFKNVDMMKDKACASCHGDGLFISKMPKYKRCSDCHEIDDKK